ncbi:MAG: YceI family protein [Spirochaetes bacterium]|nr:YceI family protein [Spirochaetota bacterium]
MILLTAATVFATDYTIDYAHSGVSFTVKHLGLSSVRGVFKKFTASFSVDESKNTFTALSAVIDVASIDTLVEQRDKHLRSDAFFDVEKYPTATFTMRSYKGNKAKGVITGDLTMHGVTKKVDLALTVNGTMTDKGRTRAAGTATTTVKRTDFGIGKPGDLPVSDLVTISLEIEALSK